MCISEGRRDILNIAADRVEVSQLEPILQGERDREIQEERDRERQRLLYLR